MEIMVVIPHQVTDPRVATIKTPRQSGTAVLAVEERRGVEMSNLSSPLAQTPAFRISE
jgi:hypothetical protein